MSLTKLVFDNIFIKGQSWGIHNLDILNINFLELEKEHKPLKYVNINRLGELISSYLVKAIENPNTVHLAAENPDEPGIFQIETKNCKFSSIVSNNTTIYQELICDDPYIRAYMNEDGIIYYKNYECPREQKVDGHDFPIAFRFGRQSRLISDLCSIRGMIEFNGSGEEDEGLLKLCNKVIPLIFNGIVSITRKGEAVHLGGIIMSPEDEGSGYKRMLDIIKSIYFAKTEDLTIILPDYWHWVLHPILANWAWELIKQVSEDQTKKGVLICNNPGRLY